jgi:hypothetical protein
MNKKTITDFFNDPLVKQAMKEDGLEEVARMASMAGVLEADGDLRRLAGELSRRAK